MSKRELALAVGGACTLSLSVVALWCVGEALIKLHATDPVMAVCIPTAVVAVGCFTYAWKTGSEGKK